MLTTAQQAVAVLAYVKKEVAQDSEDVSLLQDPFFLANLDYYFTDLFQTYSGERAYCVRLSEAVNQLIIFAHVKSSMATGLIAWRVSSTSSERWPSHGMSEHTT
jgi:hypothetical protein